MRAMMTTATAIVLLASEAMATTADVYWSVRLTSDAAGHNRWTGWEPILIRYVYATISVTVTGDNQGLAGYCISMGVYDEWGGALAQYPIPRTPVYPDPAAALQWSKVYNVGGLGPDKTVKDTDDNGGPGLSAIPTLGFTSLYGCYVSQAGASILTYAEGLQTWGLGMDSRKADLLNPGQQTYDIMSVKLDMGCRWAWTGGHTYRVLLNPGGSDPWSTVLRSDIDLTTGEELIGVTFSVDPAHIHSGFAEFVYAPPEPATLALFTLGGIAALRRNRR